MVILGGQPALAFINRQISRKLDYKRPLINKALYVQRRLDGGATASPHKEVS